MATLIMKSDGHEASCSRDGVTIRGISSNHYFADPLDPHHSIHPHIRGMNINWVISVGKAENFIEQYKLTQFFRNKKLNEDRYKYLKDFFENYEFPSGSIYFSDNTVSLEYTIPENLQYLSFIMSIINSEREFYLTVQQANFKFDDDSSISSYPSIMEFMKSYEPVFLYDPPIINLV